MLLFYRHIEEQFCGFWGLLLEIYCHRSRVGVGKIYHSTMQ